MNRLAALLAGALVLAALPQSAGAEGRFTTFKLPDGNYPHDVAPGPNGTIYYADQRRGGLGIVDPRTGKVEKVALGEGSAPHNVMVGPDGKAWLTDGGQNAMVSYDPATKKVTVYKLPEDTGYTNLNTAAVDRKGDVWFTGQTGIYGKVDVKAGKVSVWTAPKGRGPYGITATKNGDVYYASLAGSYVGRIDIETGKAIVIEPPTKSQGARRVWADSKDRIWVSEWNSGHVSMYDPANGAWKTWKMPGSGPKAYAVYVDDEDKVWLADWRTQPSDNILLSRHPITDSRMVIPPGQMRWFAHVEATIAAQGRRVRVLAVHPPLPAGPLLTSIRQAHLDYYARTAAASELPLLIVGDFNITPYSPRFRALLREGGLSYVHLGWAWPRSWPSANYGQLQRYVRGFPIDHVLTSRHFAAADARAAADVGSDHYPIVADLVLQQ